MAQEFFGYNRTNNPFAQVVSSEHAVISLGAGKVSLVQSLEADYQQDIRAVFAVGDEGLFWISGHPQGQIQVSRMAGGAQFFSAFNVGSCGRIDSIGISAQGGQLCAPTTGGGNLSFTGGIMQGVRLSMQAGKVEITEGVMIKVASLMVG